MIAALKALFTRPPDDTAEDRAQRVQLVAAAMLIETARADFTHNTEEQTALEKLLQMLSS